MNEDKIKPIYENIKDRCFACGIFLPIDDHRYMLRGNICLTCNSRTTESLKRHLEDGIEEEMTNKKKDRCTFINQYNLNDEESLMAYYNKTHPDKKTKIYTKSVALI